jgi:ribonuclease G
MANELIINASLPETRIALMEDGEIQELLIERASGKGIVGNIYKGRVTRVLPGMQAAFVDIGLEKAAFLYVDDVYVHSEIWEEEEGVSQAAHALAEIQAEEGEAAPIDVSQIKIRPLPLPNEGGGTETSNETGSQRSFNDSSSPPSQEQESEPVESSLSTEEPHPSTASAESSVSDPESDPDDDDDDDDDHGPVKMGPPPGGSEDDPAEKNDPPEGTIAAESTILEGSEKGQPGENQDPTAYAAEGASRRRHRRGRRGGRIRKKPSEQNNNTNAASSRPAQGENYPENYHEHVSDTGDLDSDRSDLTEIKVTQDESTVANEGAGRPSTLPAETAPERRVSSDARSEFRAQRSRDRRIRPKASSRPVRGQVNIQDLLKEGQEVLVQVAKDPIATKGARLTCHISLPGRHLVCMPTIDHVGVSRRIEREDERRRLREYVERNRPRNLGFIVRTASGKQQSEKRIKQDIEYLTRLWTEIKEKAGELTAPALVYEDLNSVLRAIRDWVNEDIDKVIVDSRYHFNEIQRFVSHFMPSLKQKIELYHGDIPIFDAYGISTELSRALERKVWLKSGGYIVIDQAEALVAIDVNTGRYVGKRNLEDTILKTNLEAVQEIAYQLRLRNCGGIIILDLIDMEKDENKQRVYRALEDALSRDRARPTILKISELGLVEMTRKRTRDTIVRSLCESCTHCEGKGFIKSKQTVAYEVLREIEREGIDREISKILVQANPDVIDILAIDERETLDQLERRYRKSIYLQAVNDYHSEQFEVTADKVSKAHRSGEKPTDRTKTDASREHHGSGDRPIREQGERSRYRGRDRDRSHQRDRNDRGERGERSHERNPDRGQQQAGIRGNETAALAEPQARPSGDTEAGNIKSVTSAANPVPENLGNVASQSSSEPATSSENLAILSVPSVSIPPSPTDSGGSSDPHFDEEDRLAFLRAQAAQDAALARLGNGGSAHTTRTGIDHNRGDRNSGSRRPPRLARRGSGKFRRGMDRDRNRPGHRQYGYNNHSNAGTNNNASASTAVAPVTKDHGNSSTGSGNDKPPPGRSGSEDPGNS